MTKLALILTLIPLMVLAQTPPIPVILELKRTNPPHVEIKVVVKGLDPEHIAAFKVIRRRLVDGTMDGPIVLDKESIYSAKSLQTSFVASKVMTTYIIKDKKLHPNTTNSYLYSVATLTDEGESQESNKIELRP